MAEEFNGKSDIMIASINSNQNQKISTKFAIHSFPTIVYFVPGKGMYKYKFSEQRNYENVKKWILECKNKEEK